MTQLLKVLSERHWKKNTLTYGNETLTCVLSQTKTLKNINIFRTKKKYDLMKI